MLLTMESLYGNRYAMMISLLALMTCSSEMHLCFVIFMKCWRGFRILVLKMLFALRKHLTVWNMTVKPVAMDFGSYSKTINSLTWIFLFTSLYIISPSTSIMKFLIFIENATV